LNDLLFEGTIIIAGGKRTLFRPMINRNRRIIKEFSWIGKQN